MTMLNKINNILELPKETCTKQPKIIIVGFNELIIENYKGILTYEDCFIKLETYVGVVNINGSDLCIGKMTEDYLKITGKIVSIAI